MKKVLIITYYWPPSGGSGVQRWLKHTKYLSDFGWQPIVFTPENPSFEVKDESLVADIPKEIEVIKLPIWEPYQVVDKLKPKSNQQTDLVKKDKPSLFNKLMLWVRGNFFIPDPRKFWVKPAVSILKDIISTNEIDMIITTGPPHSMHLIGERLKKLTGVKWVADFRDPWTDWELFDNFYLSQFAKAKHKKLEKKVLRNADAVVTVSKNYADGLRKIGDREVKVITNGFDKAEFDKIDAFKPDQFVIRHIGVVDELRDPRPVLQALKKLVDQGDMDIRFEFVGNINQTLKAEVTEDPVLNKVVDFRPYVPHSEVISLFKSSAVLLLVLANSKNAIGNIPGKLFEYLAARRPILVVGNTKGDSAKIVKDTNAGLAVERDDIEAIKGAIIKLKADFELGGQLAEGDISAFERRNLTSQLVEVLNAL